MSATTDQFIAALATATGIGLLRLIDTLLPRGHHLKAADKYLASDDHDGDHSEEYGDKKEADDEQTT